MQNINYKQLLYFTSGLCEPIAKFLISRHYVILSSFKVKIRDFFRGMLFYIIDLRDSIPLLGDHGLVILVERR